MSKFNENKKPVTPTAVNDMGERAYQLDPKEELVATVLTTFLQGAYYETEKEVVDRIIAAMDKVDDTLFIAKLAIYARNKANMRSVTHLLGAELARRISGNEWGKDFYYKLVVRPDDIAEIVSYYKNVKRKGERTLSLPHAMKKGFKKKLDNLDPYLIDKYKMSGKEFSLVDLVRIIKPSTTEKNSVAYDRLMAGLPLDDLYDSKILEKEMSAAGQSKNDEEMPTAEEKAEAMKIAIESVLESPKGMPIMNLIRNLRNILFYAPEKIEEACKQLTTREKIVNSRLLPFRFLSAYEEISKISLPKTDKSIVFDGDVPVTMSQATLDMYKGEILASLEIAMRISCENIPKLVGNTAILIDHSGSMRGDGGGSSLVSAFSKTRRSDIANLFGVMLGLGQDSIYIGLFGDRLIHAEVDRSLGILENAKNIHTQGGACGGSTEAGIYDFFRKAIAEKSEINNIIIFSDTVIGNNNRWFGLTSGTSCGSFQTLFKEFRKINPTCNVVSIDITQTKGTSVFDKSLRVTQIAGWSTAIFDQIDAGTIGYRALIEEINAIQI